jgi:hypothetical protein
MFTKLEILDLRATFAELRGLDDTSIDETLIANIRFNRAQAQKKFAAELPAKKIAAQAAYDAELARYLAKRPNGKNGRKGALLVARAIWDGFGR